MLLWTRCSLWFSIFSVGIGFFILSVEVPPYQTLICVWVIIWKGGPIRIYEVSGSILSYHRFVQMVLYLCPPLQAQV